MNGTVKCPICGRPYKWYSHTVADQSACPKCVAEAEGGSKYRTTNTTNLPRSRAAVPVVDAEQKDAQ